MISLFEHTVCVEEYERYRKHPHPEAAKSEILGQELSIQFLGLMSCTDR